MLVEEIPKGSSSSTYISSVYKQHSIGSSAPQTANSNTNPKKRAGQVNYNISALQSSIHQTTQTSTVLQEKKSSRRFNELDRENYDNSNKIELPKAGIAFNEIHSTSLNSSSKKKLGATAATKRILASRKTLNNYYDEDIPAVNVVLNLETPYTVATYQVKLCSICGGKSDSSCVRCGLRYCSVKCGLTHDETRCPNYYG